MNISMLFDIAEKSDAPHGPVAGPCVALEVDRADVVEISSGWLPVDRTLIQPEYNNIKETEQRWQSLTFSCNSELHELQRTF